MIELKDLSFFFENSRIVYLVVNKDGLIIKANRAAQSYHITEGQNIFKQLLAIDIEKSLKIFSLLENKKNENNTEQIEFFGYPDLLTRSRWNICSLPNTTQLFAFSCEELSKFSQQDFLLHSSLMKTIFDHDPNLITITNRAGRYLFANHSVFKFMNIPEESDLEILNQKMDQEELWIPGQEHTFKELQYNTLQIELTTNPKGLAAWFENIKVPMHMPFGEDVTLTISKDVTNWKLSEKKLIEHQQALFHNTKISYLGEMAGQIAHEINNPLAIILGNSQQLKKYIGTKDSNVISEDMIKTLEKIEHMVIRISKIIKMMQSLSVEAETSPQSIVKISDLLISLSDSVKEQIKKSNIDLQLKFNHFNHIELSCHPPELTQVFLNLIINAIEAIQKKEDLSSKRLIEIEFNVDNSYLFISISDTGIGIENKVQERIFEPFFSTKAIGHGIGLGLSLSKKIIQQHQGDLYLDLSKSVTCFVLKLPLKI